MRTRVCRLLSGIIILSCLEISALCVLSADTSVELVQNGDFSKVDGKGKPVGWIGGSPIMKTDNDNTWIMADKTHNVSQKIELQPDWWRFKLTLRMRVTGVELGKEGWQDGRLALDFQDAVGKHMNPWPPSPNCVGTTDWITYERILTAPEGARYLSLSCSMLGASGTAEFDDVSIKLLKSRSNMKDDMPLPEGADNPWDMAQAWKSSSSTRESICINGLWRFLPCLKESQDLPMEKEGWGWFKVPGIWPREDWSSHNHSQNVFLSDYMADKVNPQTVEQAWYKRDVEIPSVWHGRRIFLDFGMLHTHASVLVDGKKAGELWFPGGQIDITDSVQAGKKHVVAVLLTTRPLEKETSAFSAPDRVAVSKTVVRFKGITGDVFLMSEPRQDALGDIHVITSTRNKTITLDAALLRQSPGLRKLKAQVLDSGKVVKEFESETFDASSLKAGRFLFSSPWRCAREWDIDTPGNMYEVVVTLCSPDGKELDRSLPERFGFREFWIDGRDFYLNGQRIHLRALFSRLTADFADKVSLDSVRKTCMFMKAMGFNFTINSNYDFAPGCVSYMNNLYQAADELGMLVSFTLPHCKDFNWKLTNPAQLERYRTLTEYLVRRMQNHPSLIMYAMNHNSTGYYGDQNPARIDGVFEPKFDEKSYQARNRGQAGIAAGIAGELDVTRPVYHHQSGNLGDLYTINIYLNWAPIQERSDWLEHWAVKGAKPLFFVEWGLPHISSWSSFRGPAFIWRNEAFQQVWDSEFAAPYIGQRAYNMTPTKIESMKHEEEIWARGKPFYWSSLIKHLRKQEENYLEIQAMFADDNWRAHRTWGISAMLPWDQEGLWRQIDGREADARQVEGNMRNLQRPGIVPDLLQPVISPCHRYDPDMFELTVLGRSFKRWNSPLLGYLGGGPERFTEKGRNFLQGEKIRKQLVVLNDSRHDVTCRWSWECMIGREDDSGKIKVKPGGRILVPVTIPVPGKQSPGEYVVKASFDFGNNVVQEDSLIVNVMPREEKSSVASNIALYDPKGESTMLLESLGVGFRKVGLDANLDEFKVLVIGRSALTPDGAITFLDRVRQGLNVLVLEQADEVLTKKFGFRINIHGERIAFMRAPGHTVLAGLNDSLLRDWRGAATMVPPFLEIEGTELHDPKWQWCGFSNTRVWRCGNHGNVASVLIEKPDRGDFLPLLDCGFDLQYSPLLEYTMGQGRIIFCQMDITGRTEEEPAALKLCANLLQYLENAVAVVRRPVLVAGECQAVPLLKDLCISAQPYTGQAVKSGDLLVVGPGAKGLPAPGALKVAVEDGLNILCLGLNGDELNVVLPGEVKVRDLPAIPSLIEKFNDPALSGISNAELHWKTLLTLPAMETSGPDSNQILRIIRKGRGVVVICQSAPWVFDYVRKPYVRTTYRRSSYLAARLLANLGAASQSPLELSGGSGIDFRSALYLQHPVAEDDPYRYYRW